MHTEQDITSTLEYWRRASQKQLVLRVLIVLRLSTVKSYLHFGFPGPAA